MRQTSFWKRIYTTFFDTDLDLRIQTFNLLLMLGAAAGILMAAAASTRGQTAIVVVATNLALSVLAFLMLYIGEKKKYYYVCSWIIVILAFMIVFPLLFFYGGGHKGGMICFFILGIVYTTYLVEKPARRAALAVEIIIYLACVLASFYSPHLVTEFNHEFEYVLDILICFAVSSVMLMLISYLRSEMIHSKQTQIQELNRELVARNETLAQYDMMKSDFLATVAHEINTPLAVIAASSADTLDLLAESPLSMAEIVENQILIERRVKLIDGILLDLMDTVAIENGRISLNRQPVDLKELIRSVCSDYTVMTDTNGNKLEYDMQQGLMNIWVDPYRIEQALANLLSNAIQHTSGGTITIKLSGSGGYQSISVADDGEGMDQQTAQAALRQYVSTRADYWRHGIGLYISRRIVTAHGGSISIDSEKGKGTTITLTLREDQADD